MNIQQLSRIDLPPGDVVVAAVQFRGYLVVVTKRGVLFRLTESEL